VDWIVGVIASWGEFLSHQANRVAFACRVMPDMALFTLFIGAAFVFGVAWVAFYAPRQPVANVVRNILAAYRREPVRREIRRKFPYTAMDFGVVAVSDTMRAWDMAHPEPEARMPTVTEREVTESSMAWIPLSIISLPAGLFAAATGLGDSKRTVRDEGPSPRAKFNDEAIADFDTRADLYVLFDGDRCEVAIRNVPRRAVRFFEDELSSVDGYRVARYDEAREEIVAEFSTV
jgi:hypothetical protein